MIRDWSLAIQWQEEVTEAFLQSQLPLKSFASSQFLGLATVFFDAAQPFFLVTRLLIEDGSIYQRPNAL